MSIKKYPKSVRVVLIVLASILGALFITIVAILVFIKPPAGPFEPITWQPAPGFVVNDSQIDRSATASIKPLIDQTITDPEDVAVGSDNAVYISTGSGTILRLADGSSELQSFAQVGGRPLGIAFDARGHLLVANQGVGLQSIAPDGTITLLTDKADDTPINFANDLAIAKDGTIYFTDSNTKYNPSTLGDRASFSLYDFLEGKPRGRLLRYDPTTKHTSVIMQDLYFPNGVAISPSGDAVLVAESTRYRIARHWLSGDRANTTDVFMDNIPGILDGFTRTADGHYLLPMYERSSALDSFVLPHALARHLLIRVPALASAGTPRTGSILIVGADGQVVRQVAGITPSPSNVVEYKGQWLFGSLTDGPVYVMSKQ